MIVGDVEVIKVPALILETSKSVWPTPGCGERAVSTGSVPSGNEDCRSKQADFRPRTIPNLFLSGGGRRQFDLNDYIFIAPFPAWLLS